MLDIGYINEWIFILYKWRAHFWLEYWRNKQCARLSVNYIDEFLIKFIWVDDSRCEFSFQCSFTANKYWAFPIYTGPISQSSINLLSGLHLVLDPMFYFKIIQIKQIWWSDQNNRDVGLIVATGQSLAISHISYIHHETVWATYHVCNKTQIDVVYNWIYTNSYQNQLPVHE